LSYRTSLGVLFRIVPTCDVGFPFGVGIGIHLIGILLGLVLLGNPTGQCVPQLTRRMQPNAYRPIF
jgi:hypothetical protein